jgi:hypothetical protein
VQPGPPVPAGPGDDGGLPRGGGESIEAGELGLAALAEREPGDAAAGQLAEDLVGGQLGVEDEQAGVGAGGVVPVIGEGDDLGGLLGFGLCSELPASRSMAGIRSGIRRKD